VNYPYIHLPGNFAELGYLLVAADGHAQQVVEGRQRAARRHAHARHGVDEFTRVAAHIDHDEVGVRLDEFDFALALPVAQLAAAKTVHAKVYRRRASKR